MHMDIPKPLIHCTISCKNFSKVRIEYLTVSKCQWIISARWHIALVQEARTGENSSETTLETVGLITLEDVIEEMLQREIIEETDLFSKFAFYSLRE